MALMGFLNWKQKKPIETDKTSRYLSTHDILTGLYTRAYFEEEMARLEREGEFPVSIVIADVDGKEAMDNIQGQAAANEVLRLTVLVLRDAFRVEDVVARIGEDGFAVLLPDTDTATVKEILKRIRYSVRAQHRAYAQSLCTPAVESISWRSHGRERRLTGHNTQTGRKGNVSGKGGNLFPNDMRGENKEDGHTLRGS